MTVAVAGFAGTVRCCAAEFNATVVDRLEERRLCSGVLYKELFLDAGDLDGESAWPTLSSV